MPYINGISKYRSEIMTLSMFAILFTHLKVSFGVYSIDRLALLCQGGVDVFLFLSGYGMYYSGMKMKSIGSFYIKRIKRIFPPFLVVLILMLFQNNKMHWPDFLWGGSTLAFWFQSTNKYSFGWFVSLIVLLYAIFPWYFRLFKKNPKLLTSIGVGIGLLLTGLYVYRYQVIYPGGQNRFILPAARIPIFFIGIYSGYVLAAEHIFNERKVHLKKNILLLVSVVSLFALNLGLNHYGFKGMRNNGLLYISYIFIIPGTLVLLVKFFDCLSRKSIGVRVLNMLRKLGGCTLEAYLLIAITYAYVKPLSRCMKVSTLTSNLLLLLFTVVLAYVVHSVVSFTMNKIENKISFRR